MARAPVPAEPGSLARRVLSAVVLGPATIAAVWFGWPWLPLLIAGAAAIMAWEWARLCARRTAAPNQAMPIAVVVLSVVIAAAAGLPWGLGAALFGSAVLWRWAAERQQGDAQWLALGSLWVSLPCILLLWLAPPGGTGRNIVLWLFAIVWATDIGAYAVGRWLGGPRLAPRWSPGKTWAGLVGGAAFAALVGWTTAQLLAVSPALPLVLVSAGLAIIEQFGDLAESAAKRRFGVKDSSGLIPGHGGLLDRVDGLLAVIPAVALLSLTGADFLQWR